MGVFNQVAQFVGDNAPLIIAALVAVFLFVLYRIRRHYRDFARQKEELELHYRNDLQRKGYCQQLGHDLDKNCLCLRCLTRHHDMEVIGYDEELVDEGDGALDLSSDFQPTIYYKQVEVTRCKRCSYTSSS